MIRRGENHSFIELNLYLPQHEKAIDGNITVSREIYTNGKNSCKINGRLVTVSELKEFMKQIIDIHGQNDNQTIMDKSSHIGYLDSFIGEKVLKIKILSRMPAYKNFPLFGGGYMCVDLGDINRAVS